MALEWSYQTLTEMKQRLLRALSMVEGAFDMAAAQVVGGQDNLGSLETSGLLAQLVARSLVARDQTASEHPYRLLAPVRRCASSRATADPTVSGKVQRRRGAYCLRHVG